MNTTITTLIALVAMGQGVPSKYDWPQWRGPNRDGISQEVGLLKKWPKEGPPKLWTVSGLGGGYSTPSVAAGRIFGMSYRGNDEVVWALSEKDGSPLWTTKIASKGKVGYNEGSRCTPTVDGDRVYAVGVSGDLVCLDVNKGEILWSKNYGKDFGGRMMSGWGFSESPLVDGDWLICTPGGDKAALAALDKKTGKTIWTSAIEKAGGAGYSSIIKTEVGGVKMYVTLLGKSGGVVGVRASDGKYLWRNTAVVNGTANIPTVVARGDYILYSTGYGDGGMALLKLKVDGENVTAEQVWVTKAKEMQSHHGGFVVVGDHIYLGRGHNNGFPTCAEFLTGKPAWREDRGPGTGSGCIAYADGMLYLRYENGVVALIEANPNEYKLVSTFRIPQPSGRPSWPHPVIANGRLYLRDQDNLHCFDLRQVN